MKPEKLIKKEISEQLEDKTQLVQERTKEILSLIKNNYRRIDEIIYWGHITNLDYINGSLDDFVSFLKGGE